MNRKAREWLARGGIRPTRQRMGLAFLLVGDGKNRHVTAEDLYDMAVRAGIRVSLATVYNALRTFRDAGLLNEIVVDGTKCYFDTRLDNHPHFYWEEDGRLSDAPSEELKITRLPRLPPGTALTRIDVVIRLGRATGDAPGEK